MRYCNTRKVVTPCALNTNEIILRHQRCRAIEHHVMHTAAAPRNVCLMPFVKASHERSHNPSDTCPSQPPLTSDWLPKRSSPGAEEKKTQNKITNEVARLAQNGMPNFEVGQAHAKKKVKNGIENTAGIVGAAQFTGFCNNDCQPKADSNPDF